MAGAYIEWDDEEVLARLGRLLAATGDLRPVFNDFGEYMRISTRDRFAAQESPDGVPWARLSPAYQRHKKKNKDKILVLDGYLSEHLSYQSEPASFAFGTNRIYGATHQFGDPGRHIPARPWLGLTHPDREELLAVLGDHLKPTA